HPGPAGRRKAPRVAAPVTADPDATIVHPWHAPQQPSSAPTAGTRAPSGWAAALAAASGTRCTRRRCGRRLRQPAAAWPAHQRLGAGETIRVLADTDLDAVCEAIVAEAPAVCVVDSVQTLRSADMQSAPGSVAQVREAAERLLRVAKGGSTAIVLVGHVTKDG